MNVVMNLQVLAPQSWLDSYVCDFMFNFLVAFHKQGISMLVLFCVEVLLEERYLVRAWRMLEWYEQGRGKKGGEVVYHLQNFSLCFSQIYNTYNKHRKTTNGIQKII
jgi:hypothetical protein